MIVYLDSSVLARAYLADEDGHGDAVAMLADPDLGLITGTWSRIEVSSTLVRAARAGRGDERGLLTLLDADLATEGPVTVIAADREAVETQALQLVSEHAICAMDACSSVSAQYSRSPVEPD